VRALKDVSKEAVDATRRTIGRRKHDKKCRVHLKVGRVLQLLPETCEIAICKPTRLYMTPCWVGKPAAEPYLPASRFCVSMFNGRCTVKLETDCSPRGLIHHSTCCVLTIPIGSGQYWKNRTGRILI
jgi:hypothetical protein